MQSSNVGAGGHCEQFFAAFDQVSVDESYRNAGLTVFQVEKLLGPPTTVSSGVGQNLYTYNVGHCSANIEFANGRAMRKTFAIVSGPVPREQELPKSPQTGLVWALAISTAILLIALVWNILKNRRPPYEAQYDPKSQSMIEETPLESEPEYTAEYLGQPQDRTSEQEPSKRTEDPPPWSEAS